MNYKTSLIINNSEFKELVIEGTPYKWVYNKEKHEGRLAIGKAWVWRGCNTIKDAIRVIEMEKQLEWNTMAAIARMECELYMSNKKNEQQWESK